MTQDSNADTVKAVTLRDLGFDESHPLIKTLQTAAALSLALHELSRGLVEALRPTIEAMAPLAQKFAQIHGPRLQEMAKKMEDWQSPFPKAEIRYGPPLVLGRARDEE